MYKITGNEDTTNDDIVDTFEEEFGGIMPLEIIIDTKEDLWLYLKKRFIV